MGKKKTKKTKNATGTFTYEVRLDYAIGDDRRKPPRLIVPKALYDEIFRRVNHAIAQEALECRKTEKRAGKNGNWPDAEEMSCRADALENISSIEDFVLDIDIAENW